MSDAFSGKDPLDRFLSHYFTQDLSYEFGDAEGAVRAFMQMEPTLVPQTIARLDQLIAQGNAGAIDVDHYLTSDLEVYYVYQVDGLNGLQWLQRLKSYFDKYKSPAPKDAERP